ncbi:MAG: hypothetical protein J6I84_03725 [Bacilli bacterium]|nr:hypothetical protein [Bacilli bacterium]
MTEWNEITQEFFLSDIFSKYWNNDSSTINKVLEIQNPGHLIKGNHNFRVFFGAGIKPTDWRIWNDHYFKLIDHLKSMGPSELVDSFMKENTRLGMCSYEDGPRIIVFGSENHYKLIMGSCFGLCQTEMSMPLNLYYYPGGVYNPEGPIEGRLIRVRVFELEEWTAMTNEYISSRFKLPKKYWKNDKNFTPVVEG